MKDSTENKEQPENDKKTAEAPAEGATADADMNNEEAKAEWNLIIINFRNKINKNNRFYP